jgi:hypothetical protein
VFEFPLRPAQELRCGDLAAARHGGEVPQSEVNAHHRLCVRKGTGHLEAFVVT